jgi:hypothetical protein
LRGSVREEGGIDPEGHAVLPNGNFGVEGVAKQREPSVVRTRCIAWIKQERAERKIALHRALCEAVA